MKNKPISLRAVFKDAVFLYKKYFLLVLITSSIIEFTNVPFPKSEITDIFSFFYSVAGLLVIIFIEAIAIVYIDFHRKGKNINFLEAARQIGRRFVPLLINSILFIFLFLLGLVALIIPSILVCVIFGAAFYFVILENKGPLESFGLSRALTKGNRMKILLIFSFLILLLLPYFYFYDHYNTWLAIYNIVTGSFFMILSYSLWRSLRVASSVK